MWDSLGCWRQGSLFWTTLSWENWFCPKMQIARLWKKWPSMWCQVDRKLWKTKMTLIIHSVYKNRTFQVFNGLLVLPLHKDKGGITKLASLGYFFQSKHSGPGLQDPTKKRRGCHKQNWRYGEAQMSLVTLCSVTGATIACQWTLNVDFQRAIQSQPIWNLASIH